MPSLLHLQSPPKFSISAAATLSARTREIALAMPKSKRARVVHTSVVQKKASKEKSAALFAAVQEAADTYQHALVFAVENMRNASLKTVRQQFSDSRMFFGKTKVMAKALGTSVEDEKLPGLAELARYFKGSVGVVFTDRDVQVSAYFLR